MKWSESDLKIYTETGPSKFILSDCRYTCHMERLTDDYPDCFSVLGIG